MTLQDWLDRPWCHDPLRLNRFYLDRANRGIMVSNANRPLHNPFVQGAKRPRLPTTSPTERPRLPTRSPSIKGQPPPHPVVQPVIHVPKGA